VRVAFWVEAGLSPREGIEVFLVEPGVQRLLQSGRDRVRRRQVWRGSVSLWLGEESSRGGVHGCSDCGRAGETLNNR